jgi:hypothetical protein
MNKNSWKVIKFIIGVLSLLLTYLKQDDESDEPINSPDYE